MPIEMKQWWSDRWRSMREAVDYQWQSLEITCQRWIEMAKRSRRRTERAAILEKVAPAREPPIAPPPEIAIPTQDLVIPTAITINSPTNVMAGMPFPMSGSLAGYTVVPKLSFIDDEKIPPPTDVHEVGATTTTVTIGWDAVTDTMTPLPNATVTTNSFLFVHPALAEGDHTTEVNDGIVGAVASYTIIPRPAESPEGTLIKVPSDPPIIDSRGETWSLTLGHHVTINGAIDTRTGSAEVMLLYYHNHLVYQQNSKGTWYATAGTVDPWHMVAGPIVTHYTIIAELNILKAQVANPSLVPQINQIISDVAKLSP